MRSAGRKSGHSCGKTNSTPLHANRAICPASSLNQWAAQLAACGHFHLSNGDATAESFGAAQRDKGCAAAGIPSIKAGLCSFRGCSRQAVPVGESPWSFGWLPRLRLAPGTGRVSGLERCGFERHRRGSDSGRAGRQDRHARRSRAYPRVFVTSLAAQRTAGNFPVICQRL